jgi:predicted Zn-dependent protease
MGIREDYQTATEAQLREWERQAERLKAAVVGVEAHARIQYDKNLAALQAAQAQAWEYLHQMKGAHEAAWGQFKAHMDSAQNDVKAAAERMTSALNP